MRSRSSGRNRLCMAWLGISCAVIVFWHLSLLFGRSYSNDFDIICEVSRRVAAGGKLYVDAVDHRGPLMYAPMVFRWLTSPSWDVVFVRSVILESVLNVATICLMARAVYEAHEDDEHADVLVAIAGLTAVVLMGRIAVAEVETRVLPGCMLAALSVLRERRGVAVRSWQWFVVGLFAGYALWAKFPLCGVFVVVLVYGAISCGCGHMVRPFLLAMFGVALVSVVAFGVVLRFSDMSELLGGYVFASGGGYFWQMLSNGLATLMQWNVDIARWAFGITVGLLSAACLVRHAGGIGNSIVLCVAMLPVYVILLMPYPAYYRGPLVV